MVDVKFMLCKICTHFSICPIRMKFIILISILRFACQSLVSIGVHVSWYEGSCTMLLAKLLILTYLQSMLGLILRHYNGFNKVVLGNNLYIFQTPSRGFRNHEVRTPSLT